MAASRPLFAAPQESKGTWTWNTRVALHDAAVLVSFRSKRQTSRVTLWGYNGSAPGPTIQVNQGDRVRIIVDNHLPEATSMHWHGLEIPVEMDGAPGSSQDPFPLGGRLVYEFTLHQTGTFFYHLPMVV